jgi:hypothetical protein
MKYSLTTLCKIAFSIIPFDTVILSVVYADSHLCCVANKPIMLSDMMLRVVMLNVILLSVVAPNQGIGSLFIHCLLVACHKNFSTKISISLLFPPPIKETFLQFLTIEKMICTLKNFQNLANFLA